MADTNRRHILPPLFGVPYGVTDISPESGKPITTCPTCGHVSTGKTAGAASRAYAVHFTTEAGKGN